MFTEVTVLGAITRAVGWDERGPFTGLVEVNYPFEIRIDLSALVA